MKPVRLSCRGIVVEGIWLPPFQLHVGQWVCLHMPCRAFSKQEQQLLEVLTGEHPVSGLSLSGRVYEASPPTSRSGLLGTLFQARVVDWLRRSAGISLGEARAILTRLHLPLGCRVGQVPWTPKTLLGLEAAWARGADVIVFRTAGLDPLGRQAVFDAVSSRLVQGAALHISYPFWSNGRSERTCSPGGSCIELRSDANPPALSAWVEDQS